MEQFQFSGKKFVLEKSTLQWKFTSRPGGWILAEAKSKDGTILRKRFCLQQSRGKISIHLSGHPLYGQKLESGSAQEGEADAESQLFAQFPGKVRKVFVKEGQTVKSNQPLLKVEAMKMEFEIKSPAAGKVLKICVQDEQQLLPGDRFVEMEFQK